METAKPRSRPKGFCCVDIWSCIFKTAVEPDDAVPMTQDDKQGSCVEVPPRLVDGIESARGFNFPADGKEDDLPIKQPTKGAFIEFMKQPLTTIPDGSLMLAAARDAGLSVVRYLVEERRGDVKCCGSRGETMLHMAAEGGDVELLEYLHSLQTPDKMEDSDHATPLHYAGRQGNTDAVRFLLERGLDLDAVDGHGETCLQIAARRGYRQVMTLLVAKGAKYEVCPGEELSEAQRQVALFYAAFVGNLETVRLLVVTGTDVNNQGAKVVDIDSKDDKGRTGLWIASAEGHLDVVKLLVANGAAMIADKAGCLPIHVAAEEGKIDVISFLINHVEDINTGDTYGITALSVASNSGRLEVVKMLVEKGASLVGDKDGDSPLHMAAWAGELEVVSFLVNHANDINVMNSNGQTALTIASMLGSLDVVKVLVENGATMAGDKNGNSPFHMAAIQGYVDVVSFLLQHVDINVVNNTGQTALGLATISGHVDVVKLLVENGAGIVGDNFGNLPIHVAAQQGKVDVISFLVKHFGNIDVGNNFGHTALAIASIKGHIEVVKVLVENGATLVRDKDGDSPLHLASKAGEAEVVSFLASHFDDITVVNNNDQNALRVASFHGQLNVVKVLVENGASMAGDEDGISPIHAAALSGKLEVVSFLIQHVEDINVANNSGVTSLAYASMAGHLDVVKVLVENGATMSCDKNGDSPLHEAAKAGKVGVLSFLIQRFGEINIVNNRGQTALGLASFLGHLEVVKVLVENGAAMVGVRDGDSPLHLAAMEGKIDVISFLLQNVDDINLKNNFGHTYLGRSSHNDHLEVVKVLVENEATVVGVEDGNSPLQESARASNVDVVSIQRYEDINIVNSSGQTALGLASFYGHLEIVKLLVEIGASMIGDEKGNFPIHAAASAGKVEVVSFLIQHVEDINVKNNFGVTALVIASFLGHLEVVKLLVENGATMVGDQDGKSPLHAAARENRVDVVSFLVQRFGDINVVKNNGQTALSLASFLGHLEVVKLLVRNGAAMVGDINGFSPFHLAALEGKEEVASFLIKHVEDINVVSNNGHTALALASFSGHLEFVRLLVENGATMVGNEDGDSPLHEAAKVGKVDVVSFLIQRFGEINIVNNRGQTALGLASFLGHLEVVKLLVENGASMAGDENGISPIQAAASTGKVEVVSFLIQHVEDINVGNNCGVTALAIASRNGYLEVVKLLVKNGATMVGDEDGDSPLHEAAKSGKVGVVSFLIQHFSDINVANSSGQTAIFFASFLGHLEVVKLLVEKGATMVGDEDGDSPLHEAARRSKVDVVSFLVQSFGNINVVNNKGQTALCLASFLGHLEVVKLLVKNGASMVGDENGISPIQAAASTGKVEVVSFLIQHVENINVKNNVGLAPLNIASYNGHLEVVKLLVENGATMVGDEDGNSPLHEAAMRSKVDVVSFLVQRFGDINVVNYKGQTALGLASFLGHLEVVKLLVENGAAMIGVEDGYSPFHLAAMEGNVDVVSFLLQHVDINVLSHNGETALILAFLRGHSDVVDLLVENGAATLSDEGGDSPLHLAARAGNKEVVSFLLQHVKDVNEVNFKGETAIVLALLSGHIDVLDLLLANGASMVG